MTEELNNSNNLGTEGYPTFHQYRRANDNLIGLVAPELYLQQTQVFGRQSYRDAEALRIRSLQALELQRRAVFGQQHEQIMNWFNGGGTLAGGTIGGLVGGGPMGAGVGAFVGNHAANALLNYVASPDSMVNQAASRYFGGNQSLAQMQLYSGFTGMTNRSMGRVGNVDIDEVRKMNDTINRGLYLPAGSERRDFSNVNKDEFTKIINTAADRLSESEGKQFREAAEKVGTSSKDMADFLSQHSRVLNETRDASMFTNYAKTFGFKTEDFAGAMAVAQNLHLAGNERGRNAGINLARNFAANAGEWMEPAREIFGDIGGAKLGQAVSDLLGKNSTMNIGSAGGAKELGQLLRNVKATAEVAGVTIDTIMDIFNEGKALAASHPGLQGMGGAAILKTTLASVQAATGVVADSSASQARMIGGVEGAARSYQQTAFMIEGSALRKQLNVEAFFLGRTPEGKKALNQYLRNPSSFTPVGQLEDLRKIAASNLTPEQYNAMMNERGMPSIQEGISPLTSESTNRLDTVIFKNILNQGSLSQADRDKMANVIIQSHRRPGHELENLMAAGFTDTNLLNTITSNKEAAINYVMDRANPDRANISKVVHAMAAQDKIKTTLHAAATLSMDQKIVEAAKYMARPLVPTGLGGPAPGEMMTPWMTSPASSLSAERLKELQKDKDEYDKRISNLPNMDMRLYNFWQYGVPINSPYAPLTGIEELGGMTKAQTITQLAAKANIERTNKFFGLSGIPTEQSITEELAGMQKLAEQYETPKKLLKAQAEANAEVIPESVKGKEREAQQDALDKKRRRLGALAKLGGQSNQDVLTGIVQQTNLGDLFKAGYESEFQKEQDAQEIEQNKKNLIDKAKDLELEMPTGESTELLSKGIEALYKGGNLEDIEDSFKGKPHEEEMRSALERFKNSDTSGILDQAAKDNEEGNNESDATLSSLDKNTSTLVALQDKTCQQLVKLTTAVAALNT